MSAVFRCKICGKQIRSSSKIQVCGCSNMMEVKDDKVTAVDLSEVILVSKYKENEKSVLSKQDLEFQESRKKRKVRKLNFEVK